MKSRPSKLDAHADDLRRWFGAEKVTLEEARKRLAAAGVSVSLARLSEWWEQQQQADLEAKLFADVANGARVAKQVEALAAEAPTQVGVLVKLIERLIVQVSVRGELPQQIEQLPDLVRTALAAMKVQQDERSLAIDEAKLAILQRKAEQAEKAEKVVNDDTLTPEDKAAKIRAVFGMS